MIRGHAVTQSWWSAEGDESRAERPLAESRPRDAVAFGAVLVFTFVLVLAPQNLVPALLPLRIALLAGSLAIGAYVVGRWAGGARLVLADPAMKWTGLLVAWAVLSVPFSLWPTGSVAFLVGSLSKTLAVFWLLSHTVGTTARLRTVLWALTLMTVPVAIVAVRNFQTGVFDPHGIHEDVTRIAGYQAPLTTNPNDLALMLNLVIPLAAALMSMARSTAVRALLLGVIGLDVAAVVCTFSRGGFLTLAVAVLVAPAIFVDWRRRRWPAWVAPALLAIPLVILLALPSRYLGHLGSITNIESDSTGSAQQRWEDMHSAVALVVERPILGAGIGMDAVALNQVRGALWTRVHNVYLQYAVDLGLPGVFLFLGLFGSCLASARFAQMHGSRDLARLAGGVRVSLLAFGVAALFHPVAYDFYFYYMAALAVAAGRIAHETSPERP